MERGSTCCSTFTTLLAGEKLKLSKIKRAARSTLIGLSRTVTCEENWASAQSTRDSQGHQLAALQRLCLQAHSEEWQDTCWKSYVKDAINPVPGHSSKCLSAHHKVLGEIITSVLLFILIFVSYYLPDVINAFHIVTPTTAFSFYTMFPPSKTGQHMLLDN